MIQIALWLLVGLLFTWLLVNYLSKVVAALREIIFPLIDSKPVDLQAKFGNWAVVTGSTDGIGKAYAKELATRGINLVLISRTFEKLEKTKYEILEENPAIEVKVIVADFSKGREIFEKLAEQLKDIPVGILVNNVGMMYDYPMYVGEVPEDVLWSMININIGATTMMTRMVIGEMQKRGKGAIVNVASGSELQPLPLMTVYAASKVYVRSFTEALRAEYSRFGLTIQHLAPFYVNTKMNAYSDRLQITNVFVPDATTYAKNAISTLGKLDSSTGYWSHGIQRVLTLIAPEDIRVKIGLFLNKTFRQDYFKQKANN
ncbi:hydroxysteroid dehydrogenase-like protein 1 [Ceratina calcarata]|uniref:Hydroxysteroid dehydrogenase-like protein 1 n=1 Tax=Ceratina calcarata TaxID=156304 RepID=A0AAJ7IT82_9HYME|nr:hydroxysteroid dehydrogenase-like protein 1 [Ceratina calcarata]XP_017876667.1 hydroxysteroid dehydrogenase-like protein 1 [Ceratina calcarata]XP_017876668.1 hydroxysteroid dehydrogenase-like protein 1 [Ceratina calcarata]XP_026667677.1 hydroxysteroid dehydrogenase-like protein 1 [Ceratina calcarata]